MPSKPKAPPQNGNSAPVALLPNTLMQTLPSADVTLSNCSIVAQCAKLLALEMDDAHKRGAVALARAFVTFRYIKDRMDEATKLFAATMEDYKNRKIPELFEQEGVSHVPLDEGFRVATSSRMFVSIKTDKKAEAYKWLEDNDFGSLITSTVNSSTLSAATKAMMEEHNRELPEDLFTVAMIPNTSVTPTK